MMETIWRSRSLRVLTSVQKQEKFRKDREYEIAHLNLSSAFKTGKLTQEQFNAAHIKQWKRYYQNRRYSKELNYCNCAA